MTVAPPTHTSAPGATLKHLAELVRGAFLLGIKGPPPPPPPPPPQKGPSVMLDMKALRDWRFSVDMQGIAWAVFDREGESQNSLGQRPLEELAMIIERAEEGARDKSIRGLVFISGKEKGFIVGADVREFEKLTDERGVVDNITRINGYLDRLERLPIPVVCCIHGFCLGGGLELALACHWRIATRDDATRIGFPEVKLGLFPGFNGTARSIRQAGALAAMPLMLTGSFIRATAARGMGLIDELAPARSTCRGWRARPSRGSASPSRPEVGGGCCGCGRYAGCWRRSSVPRPPRRCARSTIPRRSG